MLYLRVGPEIGVLATKTYTAQVALLELVALDWAIKRREAASADVVSDDERMAWKVACGATIHELVNSFLQLPDLVQATLGADHQTEGLRANVDASSFCVFLSARFWLCGGTGGCAQVKRSEPTCTRKRTRPAN